MENEQELNLEIGTNIVEQQESEAQSEKFEYKTSDVSPKKIEEYKKEQGEKKNIDGQEVTIVNVGFTNVQNKEEDGSVKLPTKALSGNGYYYTIKVKIIFETKSGDKVVEYYPSVKVFADQYGNIQKNKDGFVTPIISRPNVSNSAIANIFTKYAEYLLQNEIKNFEKLKLEDKNELILDKIAELSDKDFLDGLIGKKVKIKTTTGTFASKTWFRNDIEKFL